MDRFGKKKLIDAKVQYVIRKWKIVKLLKFSVFIKFKMTAVAASDFFKVVPQIDEFLLNLM